MSDTRQTPYVHDFILGFADGLTVPFALTAGLSSLGNPKYVILAGLAELFSGSISMGNPRSPCRHVVATVVTDWL